MEEKTYKITLADGTEFSGLTLNGNNYVSKTAVTRAMFTDLSEVTIESSDGDVTTLVNAEVVQVAHYADGWYIILAEIPQDRIESEKVRADVDYIAMETGVEL